MASVAQRLAKLESRFGDMDAPARVIFLSGDDEGSDVNCNAVLAASGILTTSRDMVFVTVYERKPSSEEAPMPLRITGASTIDGRPLAL